MGEQVGGPRNEHGTGGPVWPNSGGHNWRLPRCPRGHLLSVAGTNGEFCHLYRAHQLICLLCAEIHTTGTWALIDPARQVSLDAVDLAATSGLQLVKVPPPVRYGVGRIELRIGRQVLGDIDLTLCPVDATGVIEHVRTDHRRLGYGRLLVAAARTLGPDYRWTTTTINTTLAAKAFWATIGWDGIGQPHYCSHQRDATAHGEAPS